MKISHKRAGEWPCALTGVSGNRGLAGEIEIFLCGESPAPWAVSAGLVWGPSGSLLPHVGHPKWETLKVFRKHPTFWELDCYVISPDSTEPGLQNSLSSALWAPSAFSISFWEQTLEGPEDPANTQGSRCTVNLVLRERHIPISLQVSGNRGVWTGTCVYLNKSRRCSTSLSPSGHLLPDDATRGLLCENLLFF